MGCDSWLDSAVSGLTHPSKLFAALFDMGWLPTDGTHWVPPGGDHGDWSEPPDRKPDELLSLLGGRGDLIGLTSLKHDSNGAFVSALFDPQKERLSMALNVGCPKSQSIPRIVDANWALEILKQIQERGNGKWCLHHIQFSADEPW